tara:strand:- start:50 stop:214 length:165 start_codon:yes stop_codon:yes gene_type:complete
MSKDTNQQKYAQLALKLGDLTVKSWSIEAQIAQIREDLEALDKAMAKPDERKGE